MKHILILRRTLKKKVAVGLLKMADGNEDVDFGVVLEGGKNNLLNFQ